MVYKADLTEIAHNIRSKLQSGTDSPWDESAHGEVRWGQLIIKEMQVIKGAITLIAVKMQVIKGATSEGRLSHTPIPSRSI